MSSKTFKLQIMASDHMVFDGDAQSVSLPTTEGSVGILADHSNVIMAVIPGMLEYTAEGAKQQVVVSSGLLKVENGEVMILVDAAERPEDIDEARARRAEEKARQDLKRANSNRDHAMVEAELSRALSRIKASKSRHTL
ncbi:MAG: ATP synthase F1 subunit epsilon [Mogibacterium sp.]|nr:ATP synthase F1 subunit epsilon [Mogibacterium sp.]